MSNIHVYNNFTWIIVNSGPEHHYNRGLNDCNSFSIRIARYLMINGYRLSDCDFNSLGVRFNRRGPEG